LVSLLGSVLRQFITLDPELASGLVMLLRAFKQVGASSDPALIQAAKNCVSNMG